MGLLKMLKLAIKDNLKRYGTWKPNAFTLIAQLKISPLMSVSAYSEIIFTKFRVLAEKLLKVN